MVESLGDWAPRVILDGVRARRGGHHHPQQEPQLVAQSLPRPVIDDLVQVLGQCPASPADNSEGSRNVLGDGLASNGRGKAGMTVRARSFWTINGVGTAIIYRIAPDRR